MADQPQARSIHSIQLVWKSSSTVAKDAISNKVWTQIRESWEIYGDMSSMEDEDEVAKNGTAENSLVSTAVVHLSNSNSSPFPYLIIKIVN
jgi:hypothetical protein